MSDKSLEVQMEVQILFHEYNFLRDEIAARTRDGFNLIMVAAVLVGAAVTQDFTRPLPWVLGVIVSGVIFLASRETRYRIGRAAARVREIEADINRRVGENLLVWETKWGAADKGWLLQSFRR